MFQWIFTNQFQKYATASFWEWLASLFKTQKKNHVSFFQ